MVILLHYYYNLDIKSLQASRIAANKEKDEFNKKLSTLLKEFQTLKGDLKNGHFQLVIYYFIVITIIITIIISIRVLLMILLKILKSIVMLVVMLMMMVIIILSIELLILKCQEQVLRYSATKYM